MNFDEETEQRMLSQAKLWLDNGRMFGDTGKCFQRLNIALPRRKLEWAMEQMEKAFKDV